MRVLCDAMERMSDLILEPADTVRTNVVTGVKESVVVSDGKRVYNTLGGKRMCEM